jgi:hypothetical protein
MASQDKNKPPATVAERPRIAESKKTIRAADFKSLYLNHLQVGFTRFDFQMVLGLVEVSNAEEYHDTVQETACVKMTPGYAKALVQDLVRTLQGYEELYGEISIPPPLDQPKGKE